MSQSTYRSLSLCLLLLAAAPAQQVGQKESVGAARGLSVSVLVQSPADNAVPLQIACLFEYKEGETFSGAIKEIDEKLGGKLQELRKSGQFGGHLLETLLVTPPPGTVLAKKLLLIGLGDRENFNASRMRLVGRTGLREALRLGVSRYSHASDLRDAGIDVLPVGDAANAVISGVYEAYATEKLLQEKNLAPKANLTEFIYLSGIPYFGDTKEGARKAIAAATAH